MTLYGLVWWNVRVFIESSFLFFLMTSAINFGIALLIETMGNRTFSYQKVVKHNLSFTGEVTSALSNIIFWLNRSCWDSKQVFLCSILGFSEWNLFLYYNIFPQYCGNYFMVCLWKREFKMKAKEISKNLFRRFKVITSHSWTVLWSGLLTQEHWRVSFIEEYLFFRHCVKSILIRSYFWSVFSCIRSEYRKYRPEITPYLNTFHVVRVSICFFGREVLPTTSWLK